MDHERHYDGTEESAQSIAELYGQIDAVLAAAFPRSTELWVRGEIQKISDSSGHAYLDVIDSEYKGDRGAPTLKVKCWKGTWGPLKASLRREGITLEPGMTVVMCGSIDFYKPRAEVGFIMSAVDTDALLGRIARERQALIDSLVAAGLFDAQRRLELALVPVRVGLVGSPGTEGFTDFLGQLERSGFRFEVVVVRAGVQGANAPREVAAGIATAARAGVDLICLVRGGGSKADLAAFDSAEIARAIATCPVPVWTGIGHTGDESVADLVAHQRHITPTACGVAVVSVLAGYWEHVVEAARVIGEAADQLCDAEERMHRDVRRSLVVVAQRHLRDQSRELDHLRTRLIAAPSATMATARSSLLERARRLLPAARAQLATTAAELEGRRRLLGAYDPRRTLERGWSLTLDPDGRIVRSATSLVVGASITTRMVDGDVRSTVTEVSTREGGT